MFDGISISKHLLPVVSKYNVVKRKTYYILSRYTYSVDNMYLHQNTLINKLSIVKVGAHKLQDTKFWAILLLVLVISNFSSVMSSLVNSVTIGCNGQISIPNVTAKSGSAKDIQSAVNWVVAHGGIGNVYVPEGTFNFVENGEPWMTVVIPAGVNLFGAPTERDANGQVVEWKTVLVMPWDVPGNDTIGIPAWFTISGNRDPNKSSRFSDIKLVGYRDIDPNSTSLHFAIVVDGVINFRIDHCYFRHTTEGILTVRSCGVIDHCKLVNVYGVPYGPDGSWETRTIGYGVAVAGNWDKPFEWETDATKILGQYTNYSVYIEDCYFSKWRHCTVATFNGHVILRYSIVDNDFAYGSVDIHGGDESHAGGRAVEVYDNIFKDPDPNWNRDSVSFHRGGAGVYFNNTVSGSPCYARFVTMINENPYEQYHVNDVYIWNNNLTSGVVLVQVIGEGIKENEQYYLHAPSWYMPYPYPHPLTLE